MASKVSDIFKEKKFPDWFTKHPIFNDVKQIKKVFPSIGLPNSIQDINVDNSGPAKKSAKYLVKAIQQEIDHRITTISKYINSKSSMKEGRKLIGNQCISLLSSVNTLMQNRNSFIKENNGRLALKLPKNVFLDKQERPSFREGESLFRVYNKLNQLLREGHFAAMTRLEDLQAFKTFSTDNIPNNTFKVVFSSDATDGAWDLATMSMRGIKSCQSWDGEYRHCTIGSVIDPFVGIMYLTSGANNLKHGSKMIKRCIVKFVIDASTNKPFIVLDYMYPEYDEKMCSIFKKIITDRTGGKFIVKYAPHMQADELKNTYIPLTALRNKLRNTDQDGGSDPSDDLYSIQAYQDTKIKNQTSNKNDKNATLFEKNWRKKTSSFVQTFTKTISTNIKDIDITAFPDNIRPAIRKLKGVKNNSYHYVVPIFGRSIAKALTNTIDKGNFTSSDLFMTRLYYNYFNYKSKIIDDIKAKITREINCNLQLKNNGRLRPEHFVAMMQLLSPSLDTIFKEQLKELVSKKSGKTPLPLP